MYYSSAHLPLCCEPQPVRSESKHCSLRMRDRILLVVFYWRCYLYFLPGWRAPILVTQVRLPAMFSSVLLLFCTVAKSNDAYSKSNDNNLELSGCYKQHVITLCVCFIITRKFCLSLIFLISHKYFSLKMFLFCSYYMEVICNITIFDKKNTYIRHGGQQNSRCR